MVIHGLSESVSELFELSFLKSLDELIKFWPGNVVSYRPGIADEENSEEIELSEAKSRFESGMGLLFNDANRFSPVLEEWVGAVRKDLGLSEMTYSRNLIYAIAKGEGTAAHFDQNINFVLQIHGTKKWWIASNEHIQNPMTRHTIGCEIDPELGSYAHSGMPESFPENATEFLLEPGSMLFVPRGSWHKTEALSDALSLNFSFSAPTWIDILTAALRGRLAQSSKWRETADFVADEKHVKEAVEKFDELLLELADDIPTWKAEHILGATELRDT